MLLVHLMYLAEKAVSAFVEQWRRKLNVCHCVWDTVVKGGSQ